MSAPQTDSKPKNQNLLEPERSDFASRAEKTFEHLLSAVRARGITITGDLRVSEFDAAVLLAMSAGHLKQLRQEGKSPQPYMRGMAGHRVSYRLTNLAEWIEDGAIYLDNDR